MPQIDPSLIAFGVVAVLLGLGALVVCGVLAFGIVLTVKWLKARKAGGKPALPALPAATGLPAVSTPLAAPHAALTGLFAGLNHLIANHAAGLSGSGVAAALTGLVKHLVAYEESRNHAELNSLLAHFGVGPGAIAVVDKVAGAIEDKAGIKPETPPVPPELLEPLKELLGVVAGATKAMVEQRKAQHSTAAGK